MDAQAQPLHMLFFPLMAYGHMIPMMDLARSFAEHEVTASIITTPLNAHLFHHTLDSAALAGHCIKLHLLPFPSREAGLPEGCENTDHITSTQMFHQFWKAVGLLRVPLERLIQQHHPHCIIYDTFIPWVVDIAADIPKLAFGGSGFFVDRAWDSVSRHSPYKNVATAKDIFTLPELPHPIQFTKSQLPNFLVDESEFPNLFDLVKAAERRSYGVVMNSFYELEEDYVKLYKQQEGNKVWHVGPVSLCNRSSIDKIRPWKKSSIDEDECKRWLDSMNPSSVVYISFGSGFRHVSRQLLQIALALEACDLPFIWVVNIHESSSREPWMPDGFEERMKGKGLIIRGWAPQMLVLNHPAVGAFVTHCGWNSVMEGATAGVPMITWPAFAEQFFNEKLITQVLKIGVEVGVEVWADMQDEDRPLIEKQSIEEAVRRVMKDGKGAGEGMRMRAKRLAERAKRAVEEGGSSYVQMTNLIEELKTHRLHQISKITTNNTIFS